MAIRKGRRNKSRVDVCRFCRSALEPSDSGWICPSCLVIWHGDTFELIEKDAPDYPSPLDLRFGTQ